MNEWEIAAAGLPVTGNTLGSRALRPLPAQAARPGELEGEYTFTQIVTARRY